MTYPALDGLRALAVLAVFFYHAGWLRGGHLGVDVFFALSGFLITSLILAEHERFGIVSLRSFYARRVLRLLPALVPLLAVVGGTMLVADHSWRTVLFLVGVSTYLGNHAVLWHGVASPLDHLWSLAVEEQFYALWPVALLGLLTFRRRASTIAVVGATAAAIVLGALRIVPPLLAHPLLIGSALGLACREWAGVQRVRVGALALVGGVIVAALLAFAPFGDPRASTLAALGITPLLVASMHPGSWCDRLLGVPLLRWLGRRSYAIYLWHVPVQWAVTSVPLALVVTVLLAEGSYRLIEAPALRLKGRLARWEPRRLEAKRWLAPAIVFAATVAVFLRAIAFDFIQSWDDGAMLLYNANLVQWNFRWMWTSFYFGHWAPLTWITHTVDAHLWGLWAGGWRAENILLHAGSAVSLYFIALRILGHRGGAMVAALLFAVHPLRAESVVWISERKDCLSGFFVLLAVLLYLRAVSRQRFPWWALVAFACGVMAKAIAVVVPVFLVLLDWAVLRRFAPKEKLPFVAIAVAGSVVAFVALHRGIANLLPWGQVGVGPRLLHVAYSNVYYAWRTLWPSRLSYMIEYTWVPSWRQIEYPVAVGLVGLVTVLLLVVRRRWLTAAVLAYVAAVFPQAGLFHNGPQLVANRYSYLACLSLVLLAGAMFVKASRWRPRLASVLTAGLVSAYAVVTLVHLPAWKNDEALQTYAAAAEPTCTRCQDWAAIYAYRRGDLEATKRYFVQAIAVSNTTAMPRWERHWGLAAVLEQMGERDSAAKEFRLFLAAVPQQWRQEPYEKAHIDNAEARLAYLERR